MLNIFVESFTFDYSLLFWEYFWLGLIVQKSAMLSLCILLGDEYEFDSSSKSDISDRLPINDPPLGVPADLYA